jgi:cell division ATPase FtsA
VSLLPRQRERLRAGVEIAAGTARVALVEAHEGGRPRVCALAREPLAERATERGLVRDPGAVERAVRAALTRAESCAARGADEVALATAADDLRAHRSVREERRAAAVAPDASELARARDRARRWAAREAVSALADEPALRRVALVALEPLVAGVALDGRRLVAPGRQRGSVLEIAVVAPVLPVSQASGLEAAVAPLGRRVRYVAGAAALGALAAACGIDDAIVVTLGDELTSVTVVRDGASRGARSFSVGAASFASRDADGDAETWARCAALAASESAGGAALPSRALLGASEALTGALTAALERALARRGQLGAASVAPLGPALLPRLAPGDPLDVADLLAVAAGYA